MIRLLSLSSIVLLTAVGFAQNTVVFPSDFTNREGDTALSRSALSNGIARTQILYDRRDLAIPAGRQIRRIGFRQDSNTASTGQAIQLAIFMGGTTHTATTVTSNFANNYDGVARTQVFGPTIVNLPNFTAQTTNLPFWITLTTPFTMPTNQNLLVEFVVTANNNANQGFTWWVDQGTFYTATASVGTGCQTSAGQVPQLAVSSQSYLGSNLSFSLSRAPANSLVWLNMDVAPTTPIDATPFGAPGCTLYVLPIIAVAANGNSGGSAFFSFTLPDNPALFHASIYGQCSIFDLFANNLGFTFSNSTSAILGIQPLGTTIFAQGNASATTGTVQRRYLPVTLFDHN